MPGFGTSSCGCGCTECVNGYQQDVYNNPPCHCKSNAWHRAHDRTYPPYRGGQKVDRKTNVVEEGFNLIGKLFGIGD